MSQKEFPFRVGDSLWKLKEDELKTVQRAGGSDETRLTPSPCCECGRLLDAASGTGFPKPDDFTLCAYCGSINVFNEELKLRAPTEEELFFVAVNKPVQVMRAILEEMWKKRKSAS